MRCSMFSGEKRIGHDSYEFMGVLYPHKMTDWLKGVTMDVLLCFHRR